MITKLRLVQLLAILAYLGLVNAQGLYTLVLHSYDRGAACLDGSPAGLYYHEGSGKNKNKYMIYFNSGGFCDGLTLAQTLQSCYRRSSGSLGSTKKAAAQRSFDNQGLLSTLQQNNPVFYDWTKIYVIYCDGSEYTGTRLDPISYKDKQLYFRGYNNTMEQFYYLDQHFDFYNGESIVITGVSAGGLATYFYNSYLVQHTKTAKVYAIPDSGLFITDYYSPIVEATMIRIYGENLFKLINTEEIAFPYPECFKQYPGDIVQCYNTANLAKYFKAPMLIVESPYDQYSLNVIVVAGCLTNNDPPYNIISCNSTTREIIEDYRNQTVQALYKIKGNRTDVGLWSPSCVQHGFTDMGSFTDNRFKIPSVNGPLVHQAISQFLSNPDSAPWYLDQVPWPFNQGCNGIQSKNLRSSFSSVI